MANLYVSSAQYAAVPAWTALTAYSAATNGGRGDYVRQLATPAVGSERVFRCTTGGTSGAAEPTWTLTKNAVNAGDGTVTWTECTGQEADQVAGTWKAPHARLNRALASTWGAAGDNIFVGADHDETAAATTTLTGGDPPFRVYCVNIAGGTVPPTVADLVSVPTGKITTTGAFGIALGGGMYMWGIELNAGSGAVAQAFTLVAGTYWYLKKCSLNKKGTSAGTIQLGANGAASRIWLDDTFVTFGNTSDSINGFIDWIDTADPVRGATIPTALFPSSVNQIIRCTNVDFSSVNTAFGGNGSFPLVSFENCKFHASATFGAANNPTGYGTSLIRSDSADTNYRHDKKVNQTTQSIETTIVRTGGASDGGTTISWKITGNPGLARPFISTPFGIWLPTAVPVTLTVYGIHSAATQLTQDDIWFEVDYLASATTSLGAKATSGKVSPLHTASTYTVDAVSTWGGGSAKFLMSVTFTPGRPCLARAVLKYARNTGTTYIDPKLYIS